MSVSTDNLVFNQISHNINIINHSPTSDLDRDPHSIANSHEPVMVEMTGIIYKEDHNANDDNVLESVIITRNGDDHDIDDEIIMNEDMTDEGDTETDNDHISDDDDEILNNMDIITAGAPDDDDIDIDVKLDGSNNITGNMNVMEEYGVMAAENDTEIVDEGDAMETIQ